MNARRKLWITGAVIGGILLAGAALLLSDRLRPSVRYGHLEPPLPDLEDLEPALARRLGEVAAEVEAQPYSARAWGRLGSVLDVHDLFPEAIACYERARLLDPKDFRWPYFLGVCKRIGDQEGALADFERARRLNADYAPLEIYRGSGLLGTEQLPQAAAAFERARALDPALIRSYIGLAQVALARSDPAGALAHLQRALELKPQEGEVHWLLAETYRRRGDVGAAERHSKLAQGLRNLEPLPDPLRRALWWNEGVTMRWRRARSESDRKEGRLPQVLAEWEEAARQDPGSAEVQLELGRANAENHRLDKAQEHYRRSIALRPDYARAHQELGTALAAAGKTDEAIATFTRALELDPDFHEARFNLGGLLIGRGKADTGLKYLRQAAEAMPDRADAQFSLGLALATLGKPQESMAALERVLNLEPDHVGARVLRERLRVLTNEKPPGRGPGGS